MSGEDSDGDGGLVLELDRFGHQILLAGLLGLLIAGLLRLVVEVFLL